MLSALTKEQRKDLVRDMEDQIRQTNNQVNDALARLRVAQRWLASLERRTAELVAEIQEKDRGAIRVPKI